MTVILKKKSGTASQAIREAQAEIQRNSIPIRSNSSPKYRHLVLKAASQYHLSPVELKSLAGHLGIEWISPPRSIPKTWTPSISTKPIGIKYTNPNDSEDYAVLVSSQSIFGVKGIIRHTSKGYLDISWFTEFVPMLADVYAEYESAIGELPSQCDVLKRIRQERALMSRYINDSINAKYDQGMTVEQSGAIHALLKTYMPGVEGLCRKCYKLFLPRSGLGESWQLKNSEIRLSAPKVDGRPGQRILYVTHQIKPDEKEVISLKYEGIVREPEVKWLDGRQPLQLTNKEDQLDTHIPWEIYDSAQIISELSKIQGLDFPICQCQ